MADIPKATLNGDQCTARQAHTKQEGNLATDAASPPPATYAAQHELLDQAVLDDGRVESIAALRQYFNQDSTAGSQYTRRLFERLDGGGDAPDVQDQVTSADVLSLSFLSMTSQLAKVTIAALMTHADEINRLLRRIPTGVPMHKASWATYAANSPAYELWQIFKRCGGKNRWVTANKLLARKRPHLIPVYDRRVKAALGVPESVWGCLWTWFADDSNRAEAVADLRSAAGDIEDISLLRCLDVALWMRASTGRNSRSMDDE